MKYAIKAIAAFCRLQKPPRIYIEKPVEDILHSIDPSVTLNANHRFQPGDRDDNLWVTYHDFKAPKTQNEWEQICFLDKLSYGYYQWPKMIKYSLNKRERYTCDQMPQNVSIIYDRFLDKNFVARLAKVIIFDEKTIEFKRIRFLMYKVYSKIILFLYFKNRKMKL